MAGRSRFAEETVADAVADGARQVVILGGQRAPLPGKPGGSRRWGLPWLA
ncbi:class I SAM-dependent methyltransferase [Nocardia sp. NBC_01499]